MHATSFPPSPRRQIVLRDHGHRHRPGPTLLPAVRPARVREGSPVDWAAECRLATVMSAIAVIVAVGLHGIVPPAVIVVGMAVVSGALAWRRLGPRPDRRTAADVVRR